MSIKSPPIQALHIVFIFMLGATGCQSSTPTLTPPSPTALALTPTPPLADLPTFFAQSVAASGDIVSARQARFIIYSHVIDVQDLRRGVSQRQSDMQQCWLYQARTLSECSEAEIERAFYPPADEPPLPKMFFAIATQRDDEVLVILDYKHYTDPQDAIDGYRYVLQLDGDVWQVKSWTSVY